MGGLVTFNSKGDFSNTKKYLNKLLNREYLNVLDKYGKMGVKALEDATPKDTGLTSTSWYYRISVEGDKTTIGFYNDSTVKNKTGYEFNIVILLQYGHATRNGGWVEANDFVNPTIKPIFDEIANAAWNEILDS